MKHKYMRRNTLTILLIAGFCLGLSLSSQAASSRYKKLAGPATAKLGSQAQIDLPVGYEFLDGPTTRALMKASGEPTSDAELGLIMPTNADWSVLFEYQEVGYVKDDDKDKLNADKLLQSIKEGTAEANKERVRNGVAPLEIVGWEVPPRYDEKTHNLEWAVRATSEGRQILNYNTRLLGRKGVMEVVLIVEPEQLQETLPTFRNMLANYSFQTGQTYAEYRSGDKVAKYGLAALVVGGAAVGAAKLGLLSGLFLILKKGWKLVVLAVAAVIAAIKKLMARVFGGRQQTSS